MVTRNHVSARQIQALILVRKQDPRRPDIIIPLLARRAAAGRDLELGATRRRAIGNVEAHRVVEDLDLSSRERPFLGVRSGARLHLHLCAIGVRRRGKTKSSVISRLDEHWRKRPENVNGSSIH